jgi:hypothetical protein
MAITVPIITEFDSKAIKLAERRFKQFGREASQVGDSIKKAMLPAAAAVGALAVAGFSAVKAAVEDQAASAELARQLKITTKATDAQVASVEKFVEQLSLATGVSDSELRPALAKLVRVTGSVSKSQKLVNTALNIAAATGKPLSAVTDALSRAYGGNVKALARLDPALKALITKTTTADEAVAMMSKRYDGAAAAAADTYAGRLRRVRVALEEAQEAIGYALLPILEKLVRFITNRVVPYVQKLIDVMNEKGLAGAAKTAARDVGNFIQDLDGWQGALFDFTAAVVILTGAIKGLLIANSVAGAFSALAGALTAVGGVLGGGFAITAGAVATAFVSILATVAAFIGLMRSEQKPIFLEYLKNTAKLIANAFILIYNTAIDTINLLPKLANFAIPGFNPVGTLGGKMPYFDYTYGAGDFQYGTGAGSFRRADEMKTQIVIQAGIGDPASIGREVQKVLDAQTRRSGGK